MSSTGSVRRTSGMNNRSSSNRSVGSHKSSSSSSPPKQQQQLQRIPQNDLEELEFQLEEKVNAEFFQNPQDFYTTHFVIDVLGAQLETTTTTNVQEIRQYNPAYKALQQQQAIVEKAIEHVAICHCADLNASVVHVGRVSRQLAFAVTKVQSLQTQVQGIQETLGTSNMNNTSTNTSLNGNATTSAAHAAAMSLRELWLKKLECQAILSLLENMNIVRHAPAQFDALVMMHHDGAGTSCRIGAAVNILSRAFDIAFNSQVTYVAALQTISQQITNRKQIANSIIWESLEQVLYLRTGNESMNTNEKTTSGTTATATTTMPSSGTTVASVESKLTHHHRTMGMMKNPFVAKNAKWMDYEDYDWDAQSFDTVTSASSLFSKDSSTVSGIGMNMTTNKVNPSSGGNGGNAASMGMSRGIATRMMIPLNILEAELDLEQDERRCLVPNTTTNSTNDWEYSRLPRYQDSVLALRILTKCLEKLGRLDDVERTLHENLQGELRKLAQTEQAKTFMRLERGVVRRSSNRRQDLKDFRRHLRGLLSSFGCVMLRLSHLAQILRHVITTDKTLVLPSYPVPSSAMHSVLVSAYDIMQREIKEFLKACLRETEKSTDDTNAISSGGTDERGFFSLGITNDSSQKDAGFGSLAASRARNMELPAGQFVVDVLFPKTNTSPDVRHALEFRKALAKWTAENEALKKELAIVTGEDTSTASYNAKTEETALDMLDAVIKRQLIPILQDDALKGTTSALERGDAFDPVIDHNLYGKNSNEPQDVDMCIACQALYYSTESLFQALHRLPQDEKMYLHLVGVLEHAVLTFTSRVTPRVQQICSDKMAHRLLIDGGKEGKENSFNMVVERRRAYAQLCRAYADGDLLEKTVEDGDLNQDAGLMPLSAPTADTSARNTSQDKGPSANDLDLAGGIEREEQTLLDELLHLQPLLEFTKDSHALGVAVCSDEELMKASCLAHSLLKLASLLDSRLKVRSSGGFEKVLPSTRALREAIKSIRNHGIKMAKFCRIDMLMQSVTRLSKICRSSTVVAKDAVRIPSCVNDLGEYLTAASDNLREASGNAVTAYTFSSLEQYIPLFLMQTVRVIAGGGGIISKSPLTLNGVEALDRSGSVLYRDLKGATGFDNSFWDDELAAISFERSASFMAMMELEMEELEAYYRANHDDFSESDFQLMFSMNGPRRRGDIGRYNMLKRKLFSGN